METKVKIVMDNVSLEEAIEMMNGSEATEDGRWKSVYNEKVGGFYHFLMVLTEKGKFYKILEDTIIYETAKQKRKNKDYPKDNDYKLVYFTSYEKDELKIKEEAISKTPNGYKFLYCDLIRFSNKEDSKQIYEYRAMYI